MQRLRKIAAWLGVLFVLGVIPIDGRAQSHGGDDSGGHIVLDDFESYASGALPTRWRHVTGDREIRSLASAMDEDQRFYVVGRGGNQFVRAYTHDEALRITLRNGHEFDWNLQEHPRLAWRWRAQQLPKGANEKYDRTNDTGAAVYVTFGADWLGRPISIKYTYSSTLPVGTVVDYGPLIVMVVDSAHEPGTGQWKTVTRNVIADYRQLFGETPPERPVSITLWSDTDTTNGIAEVDFDDIQLLPPR